MSGPAHTLTTSICTGNFPPGEKRRGRLGDEVRMEPVFYYSVTDPSRIGFIRLSVRIDCSTLCWSWGSICGMAAPWRPAHVE